MTVVLLGHSTEESKWVQWEVQQSIEKKNGILAIKLYDDVPNPSQESTVGRALYDAGAEIIGWDVTKFQSDDPRAEWPELEPGVDHPSKVSYSKSLASPD